MEKKSIDDILIDCYRMEKDHNPEEWPAIQMKTVTALCDEVRRLTAIISWSSEEH